MTFATLPCPSNFGSEIEISFLALQLLTWNFIKTFNEPINNTFHIYTFHCWLRVE